MYCHISGYDRVIAQQGALYFLRSCQHYLALIFVILYKRKLTPAAGLPSSRVHK